MNWNEHSKIGRETLAVAIDTTLENNLWAKRRRAEVDVTAVTS